MFNKIILSEIAVYIGEIKMPKNFEIKNSKLIVDIFNSKKQKKLMSDNELDYSFNDYKIYLNKQLIQISEYINQHLFEEHKLKLVYENESFGNIYFPNEQSYNRRLANTFDLRNTCDYVMVLPLDVAKDSCKIVMEYNDNRSFNRSWHIPLETNKFILFPSMLRYFISKNLSKQANIFLTQTYLRT
jgi:hypothetical protein